MPPQSGTSDTPPIDDKKMWRRLMARVHPDAGGSHELMVWVQALEEHIKAPGKKAPGGSPFDDLFRNMGDFAEASRKASQSARNTGRAASDFGSGFDEAYRGSSRKAWASDPVTDFEDRVHSLAFDIHRECLEPLIGRFSMYPHTDRSDPPSPKQVARLAHTVGMTGYQRGQFYGVIDRLELKRNAVSWLIDYWQGN